MNVTGTAGEAKRVPALRFPEFSGAWEEKRLGEMFSFKNGFNADKTMYGTGRKFINVMDVIADHPITSEKIIGLVEISDKDFEKNEVEYGDILFQRSSETREEVGQTNVYLDKDTSATFGGFVIRGKPIVRLNSEFFNRLLMTAAVRRQVTNRSGGSTRYNVGQESLSSVPVYPAPTLPEQKKIAAFLGVVDAKIAALKARQEGLERYKRGLMQALFSQRLRFTKPDGTAFPDWEEKRLGEVADIVGGGTPDTNVKDYWNGEVVWFTPSEIKKKYLTTSVRTISKSGLSASSAKILPVGALVLSTRATVGDVGIATQECATNQGFQSLVMKEENLNEFWYYWLVNNKKALLRRSAGSTFLEIGKSEVRKIPALAPHRDEQQKIAEALQAMDAKIAAVAGQVAKMEEFKKGLLQQMFV
ncbi:MAG: restriction endonuclease subunit S [Pseudoruegeria sp.]